MTDIVKALEDLLATTMVCEECDCRDGEAYVPCKGCETIHVRRAAAQAALDAVPVLKWVSEFDGYVAVLPTVSLYVTSNSGKVLVVRPEQYQQQRFSELYGYSAKYDCASCEEAKAWCESQARELGVLFRTVTT